ncbi:hypothetical protein [Oligoflexus tunisiensis]|uniref:hypothetical protein n=1 Tax=Oligoflexus tunisiensis TaxID=708132 RepID=UPI00114CB232|nr:hypothetical protein [Oligoflexus tunisiensis]
MKIKNHPFDRRQIFKAGGAAAMGAAFAGSSSPLQAQAAADKKYIFNICAFGGANIIDSFLAQPTGPAAYNNIVQPNGSAFKTVPPLANSIQGAIDLGNGYDQAVFVQKHGADMMVMTCEVSSVNHIIAAKRSMTGDNINGGRTIAEAVALAFGKSCPLPNLMLAGGGYALHGDDDTVPDLARAQAVNDPLMFAFATHGFKGMTNAMSSGDMAAARKLRNQLESVSRFQAQFAGSRILDSYQVNRERIVEALEKGDMVTKLMMLDPATNNLAQFGFNISADINLVRAKFPNMATDPFEARLALGFLAAKNGLSNAISVGPSNSPLITAAGTPNAPIAFDWSHVDHRGAQNSMWSYILKGMDALIDLLKATDVDGDPAKGKMWDRSLIYIATEFGRDKVASGGSGHHLNNGVVVISPMVKGNSVFGGVDAATGLTYGFDPATGAPMPNTVMKEKHHYSAIAQAMGINFDNRVNMAAVVKKA